MKYEVTLLIDRGKLALVTSLLDKSDGIEIAKIERKGGSVEPAAKKYANGKRFKGISGLELIEHTIQACGGKAARAAILKEFAKRGFAEKSAPSAISKALREKHIVMDTYGHYSLYAAKPSKKAK